VVHADAPFGKVHGMLLTMGRGLTTSLVYTDALLNEVARWSVG
jgi:hypothetical protein